MQLTVAFDAYTPFARWAPLFHVLRLEHPSTELAWRAVGFPTTHGNRLDGADVGLLVEPLPEAGVDQLTLQTGPMAVMFAAGHPLARGDGVTVAEILDEVFPGGSDLDPRWCAIWTLDEVRGGPARLADDDVHDALGGLALIASGRAIGTVPAWTADGLHHPGVLTVPLHDGPEVATRLAWRAGDPNPMVPALVDLARAWTGLRGDDPGAPEPGGGPRLRP